MDGLSHQERVAVARLRALLELLPVALDRHLVEAGITSFEFTLLEALHEDAEARLRLSVLAARTNATLPRLSRVVTSLERKGLVTRTPCPQDARATNATLTAAGETAYRHARPLYETAVRRLVLDGLGDDGASRLAELAYAMLTRLDPARRLAVTADADCPADPAPCPADPEPCPADPAPREPSCPADPAARATPPKAAP
ncbi:MarR family transcriptional regulator [Xylanimonas allomyrinae]|uniref:MarR family transcriptional regulator n=1 Tax=Xylanimonas allomyrinae TaxID=2509459 RepID=A0A4P6EWU6_9MICO|nr:MarR family transcriptional regulator [Xylanimonas allomyrinae]QAY62478.1 MarR family transcriptional regulator [Xylanimonas allomyrinae]